MYFELKKLHCMTFMEWKFCFAGKTTAINFRETTPGLEQAETMGEFERLIQKAKERGKTLVKFRWFI